MSHSEEPPSGNDRQEDEEREERRKERRHEVVMGLIDLIGKVAQSGGLALLVALIH